jgi:citrate lyase subunit beta/citryl-CoA lyase
LDDDSALSTARGLVVLASAAAGVLPPVAPVSRDFRDLDAFRSSTSGLRRAGYLGRACIHPAQVEVANAVFTPSAQELERARDILRRSAAAEGGVALDADGGMLDAAVVRQAERLLALTR